MPTVDVDPDELRRFVGEERDDETLKEDLFGLGLEFEGRTEDGDMRLEFEPDRLDRLSVEGIARSLRYQYGTDRGVYLPDTNDPEWTVRVEDVPAERPYVTAAVARGLDLDEAALESIIQLQEKLHATIGRGRAKGAIGVHDLTFLQGSTLDEGDGGAAGGKAVRYTGIDPDGDRFVPLDSDAEMTPADVLADHPIGEDYADLVADYGSMPAIYDEVGLFSFPPVINGRRTEVSTESRDLFVEMTGTDQWTVDRMLNIVCYALDARGAQLEEVRVEYPDRAVYDDPDVERVDPGASLVRPDLSTKTKTVTHDRLTSLLGVELSAEEVLDRLERSGLDAEAVEAEGDGRAYRATVPPYRVDVLHPLDVVDDVGRAHGFNELEPRYPDVSTVGGRDERSRFERAVRERLVGQGFEDTLNFHLVGAADNYDRMRLDRPEGAATDAPLGGAGAATIKNPYSAEYEQVRTWALPSLVLLLENNTHREYPQRVSEVGFAATRDESEPTGLDERTTVAAAVAATDAGYDDAKGHLQSLAGAFDADLSTPATDHPSFIDGRAATVELDGEAAGVVGELHPAVLVEHDLEVPAAAFEFRLDALR